MAQKDPFFFGIPLIARDRARNWNRVCELFERTLRSALAQTDLDFTVLLAAHDLPDMWQHLAESDPRLNQLRPCWAAERPTVTNDDAGAKKWLIEQEVRARGGGLLMFLDADDLVDHNTVSISRERIGPHVDGGLVVDGFAIDHYTGQAVRLPHPDIFPQPFHALCGSTTVARIGNGKHVLKRLGSHHIWLQNAAKLGLNVVSLPLVGAYVVGTGENHSERDGPFADWRRRFSEQVIEVGTPIDDKLRRTFGLSMSDFREPVLTPTDIATHYTGR